MFKRYGILAAAILAAGLFAAPVMAEDKPMDSDMNKPAMMKQDKEKMGGHMMDPKHRAEHQKMMQDTLGMARDVMVILRDMKHQPSAEQQKKLDGMIKRMDEIIKQHEDMVKKSNEMTGW